MPSLTPRLAVAVIAATLILAAGCGDATTNVMAPERPSYDGGYTIGGGHRSSDTTTTTAATSSEGAAESGGYTIGGGH
jgi:hypothetical protein